MLREEMLPDEEAPDPHLRAVRTLLSQSPLVDAHNDLPLALLEQRRDADAGIDRLPSPPFFTGLDRLRAGGVGAQVWVVYREPSLRGDAAIRAALEQFDRLFRMLAPHSTRTALARTADDVERLFVDGRLASLIGVEGGQLIGGSLGVLRTFAALGMCYLGLTHDHSHDWADAAQDAPRHGGLSPFGVQVVHELNRLGVLVDLAHAAESTAFDALASSSAPVIVSHANAKRLCPHPRNVSDRLATAVAAAGGVVMVTFVPYFLTAECASWSWELIAAFHRSRLLARGDRRRERVMLDAWRREHPRPEVTLDHVADHLDYLRRLIGAEHVGIGSDYDGVDVVPSGLESPAGIPRLLAELRRRGWSDDEIVAVAGGSFLRVMRAAEAVATR